MKKSLLTAWLVLLIALPILVFSQSRQITGTVSDEKGQPLAFVSVIQKGTQNGTTTNEKGTYSISVNGANPVLVFSYAGRQSQEVAVGAGNIYDVTLSSNSSMSEVVVTALGITRKKKSPRLFSTGSFW